MWGLNESLNIVMATDKVRFIQQLPAINQTDTLKNFFASTVDELFQPGVSEPISGYIGQKPSYYDPTTDFYIAESTSTRTAYQLEPAMISMNTAGVITETLTYDDLVNYMASQGAVTDDHSRMFEGDYYSWCPPIDIDKINNYSQYVWMGALTGDQANSVLTLRAPRSIYVYDGLTNSYALPSAIDPYGMEPAEPTVLVNGQVVDCNVNNNIVTIDTASLSTGAIIETILYGDLTSVLGTQAQADLGPFLSWIDQSVNYTTNTIVNTYYEVGDVVYGLDAYGNGSTYICNVAHMASTIFFNELETYWLPAPTAQQATSGVRVRLIDGIGTSLSSARYFFLDGVGQQIAFDADYTSDANGSTPQYVVIDRRSKEGSPWALRNLWTNIDTLTWAGQDFSARRATRPIIEFLPNMELYNYGTNRLPDVQATLSNTTATVQDAFGVYPFGDNVYDQGQVPVSSINGQFFGKLHDPKYTGGSLDDSTYLGSVVVDNGYILQPNNRLFVKQTSTTEPELNNLVYAVVENPQTPLPSGGIADVVELVFTGQPQRGDIFRISNAAMASDSVFGNPVEYWYDGTQWTPAQNAVSFPLFRLFDSQENPLDDTNTYPGTDFAGNKLFSYQIGNGTVDSVLGIALNYNTYSQPIFENNPVIDRVTYNSGVIPGFYYHHFVDVSGDGGPGTFSNDWYAIANASTQSIANGVYSIPLNLQGNPDNEEVTTISRNQWFEQFSDIMLSQANFVGQPYSINNWRDTARVMSYGSEILQHRSPLLKTMLVSADTNFDIPASISYTEQEYIRYRNIFVQTILTFYKNGTLLDTSLPTAWVAAVLKQQTVNKNSQFPFAYSNMAGGQYFMPPTPAALGLAQVAIPGIYTDMTYTTPLIMIRGHDGSLTPAFGDFRDQIMVQLELTIYNNIPAKFKTEARPVFDLEKYIEGKFYSDPLGYTQDEITEMVTSNFLRWAQANRLDYMTNSTYDSSNPFTWNYSQTLDQDGESVPGYWRGIYRHYYDTDRPHLAPWEMLGFIDKPVWWQNQYGPEPYTAGNVKLWSDLENGTIRDGVRVGTDVRYARPGLSNYLPVDQEGNLLDPIAAKIIPTAPTQQQASANWVVGDFGPVESLWRVSSSCGFAMAIAGFLAKPARFVEQGWDTINQVQDSTGQWIYEPTGDRPTNSNLYVHGELVNNAAVVVTGNQQWISDYMVSRGQSPSTFGAAVRGLDVRLAHKMAGFVSGNNLSVSADNFGLIPAEDFSVVMYNSPSTAEYIFSGVLIEKTTQGWRVVGYDTRSPWFTTIPGLTTGPKGIITLATSAEPVIHAWKPNVRYAVGMNVSYQNAYYTCVTTHTSSANFYPAYWSLTGVLPAQAPRVTTYTLGQNTTVNVPYGTVFTTYQQVADFLTGYGRYLTSVGWQFTSVNSTTQESVDWNLMTKEFLKWSQVQWQPGNFITLSPAATEDGLLFQADQGYVMNMLNPIDGVYGIIERTGQPIDRANVVVNRIDGQTNILSKNEDIYGARVNIAEVEHILIFNQETIFADIIYDPLFNLRQPRLLLIGFRSQNWAGRLDAPGYMLINNQIQSNYWKAANDLLTMWDIEQGDNATLVDHARFNIGYDSRDYLTSLVLSEVEQFEFYQGMIHQKGAPGAFTKLLRSDYIDQSRQINFFEEWAFKLSEYGAVNTLNRIAFLFGQTSVLRDPQFVEFRVQGANTIVDAPDPNWIELIDNATTGIDSKWIERPTNPLQTFAQRPTIDRHVGDLPVAGYVRLDEVDYTVFNTDAVSALYDANSGVTLPAGDVIWIHENDQVRQTTGNTVVQNWYVLGNYDGNGFWDGSNTMAVANSYQQLVDGQLVFVSHANDAPFITDNNLFIPVPGQTYSVNFTVSKISNATDNIATYVRPAFDAFDASGNIYGALGIKSGVGYNSANDLIDTSSWVIGVNYIVSATWTCPNNNPAFVSARGRLRVNRTYPADGAGTMFSDAIYQISDSQVTINQPVEWDALKVYNMSADGSANYVSNVVTTSEDPTLSNSVMRIYTLEPHGLSNPDIGLFFVIDGETYSNSNLQGVYNIANVGSNFIEVAETGDKGYEFTAQNLIGPPLRILRSIHFDNANSFISAQTRPGLQDGEIAYVDGPKGQPWAVYQRNSITVPTDDWAGNPEPVTTTYWQVVRSQPNRVDARTISGSTIYDLKTSITSTDLQPEPETLDYMTVVSPLTGIIAGTAKAEIDYMLEYDPAFYNNVPVTLDSDGTTYFANTSNSVGNWGPAQVGRVWWDLSTVRFLETETDNVSFGVTNADRYTAEVRYRVANWAQIAPATSVDIYEWYRSTVDPVEYTTLVASDTTGTYVGEVYNAANPSWVQSEEYVNGTPTTFYYFWVKGLDVVPAVNFRNLDIATVTQLVTNPLIEDIAWIAPILPNGMLIGGVSPFVDDVFDTNADGAAISGTVVQVKINGPDTDLVAHDEWFLMRPNDELSMPPNWLWDKIRDSLVGFGDNQIQSPAPLIIPAPAPITNNIPVWYTQPGPNGVPISNN